MDTIITQRLRIRPMARTDLRALQSLYGEPELMKYITGKSRSPHETRARLKKDLRQHQEFGFGLCVVEWLDTDEVIGRCGLEPRTGRRGLEGELAWMFSEPWWGRGLATEAGAALISFGLAELTLSRVFAKADRRNEASIRVMRRLGMTLLAHVGDEVEYEILPEGPQIRSSAEQVSCNLLSKPLGPTTDGPRCDGPDCAADPKSDD